MNQSHEERSKVGVAPTKQLKTRKSHLNRLSKKKQAQKTGYVSTDVGTYGLVNPIFPGLESLVERREDFLTLGQQVLESIPRREDGLYANRYDVKSYMAGMHDPTSEAGRAFAKFKELMSSFETAETPANEMPPPPHRLALYERIEAGTEILDVGGGDGTTLAKFTEHLDVINLDPDDKDNPMTVQEFNDEGRAELLDSIYTHIPVVTTFNSLTQLTNDEVEVLEDMDGIHIFPDYTQLTEIGAVATEDDKTFQCHGVEWVDNKIQVEPHLQLDTGYCAYNTFQKEVITLFPESRITSDNPAPGSATAAGNFVGADFTPKYDGMFHQLRVEDEKFVLVNRRGEGISGRVTTQSSRPIRLVLDCELVQRGRSEAYIALRVRSYRNYVPFHSQLGLKKFVSRVKIKIHSLKRETWYFIAPKVWDGHPHRYEQNGFAMEIPMDGIIVRHREIDYYIKNRWTVDVKDLSSIINALEEDEAWQVEVIGDPPRNENVHEWFVDVKSEGVCVFTYSQERPDRTEGETVAGVVGKIVSIFL